MIDRFVNYKERYKTHFGDTRMKKWRRLFIPGLMKPQRKKKAWLVLQPWVSHYQGWDDQKEEYTGISYPYVNQSIFYWNEGGHRRKYWPLRESLLYYQKAFRNGHTECKTWRELREWLMDHWYTKQNIQQELKHK